MPMITWLFRKLMYKSVPDLQGLQHPLNTDFLPQRLFRMLITCPFQKINGQIAPGLYLISFRKLQVFFFLEKTNPFTSSFSSRFISLIQAHSSRLCFTNVWQKKKQVQQGELEVKVGVGGGQKAEERVENATSVLWS